MRFLNILENALNSYLRLDPESFKQLRELQDQCVEVQITDFSVRFFLSFKDGQIQLSKAFQPFPSVAAIKATSWQLMTSAFSHQAAQNIQIEGNVELGYQVYGIFKNIQIDWEEQLSHYTGDIIAHQVGNFARRISNTIGTSRMRFRENVTEFLQEEAQIFPTRLELEDFYQEIEWLRQQVERLEAYVERAKEV